MSTYNTVIKKRNSSNNGWDSILPITIADNVLMGEGGETVASQLADKANKVDIGMIVAGIIRNNGSGWEILSDGQHTPMNLDSVEVSNGNIVINHASMEATKVISMVVNSDETYIAEGYTCGVSVGLDHSIITVMRNKTKGGYIYYDGTKFVISPTYNNGIASVTWRADNNTLLVGLTNLGASKIKNVSVSANGLSHVPVYGADSGGLLYIQFRDFAGNLITTPDAKCKVWLNVDLSEVVDASNLTLTNGNFWIYGLFK